MKSIFTLLLSAFLISAGFSQSDKRLKGLDAELNDVLSKWKAAGFAVAVVEKDKVVYAKGFGYRDYENKVAADENTLFAIGSCSKAFTASLLGLLEGEEKLSLTDHPSKYVPELSFSDAKIQQGVRIKDLMTHMTGLPRHDLAWYLFPSDDKDSLISRIQYHKPFAGLRERWYYNNFMYLTQGVIAERITGKSWEENMYERFFEPLDMKDSRVSSYEAEESSNAAKGYTLDNDKIEFTDYYRISGMAPAGSIYSSVSDMAKWVKVWISGGKNGEEDFLPAGYFNQAMNSQAVISGGAPGKERSDLHFGNYGYGWMMSSYKGHYRVEHGGNIDGFSASTSFYPSDSLGIIVLVNQDGSSVPSVVRNTIADRMLKVKKTDWSNDLYEERYGADEGSGPTTDEARIEGTQPTHALEQFTGEYSNPGYGSFQVLVENDSLYAQFKRMKLFLAHYHYNIFNPLLVEEDGLDTLDLPGGGKFNFRMNDVGEINELAIRLEPALEDPILFARTPNDLEVSVEDLEKYVGKYQLGPMESTVSIKEEKLRLFVPGQPEYELAPIAPNKFRITSLQGFKVEFTLDEDGKVDGFKSIQPNGTFPAKRKEE